MLPIYFDYAATTPVDPRVAKVMMECLTLDGNFGNAASRSHVFGWRAEEAIEQARQHVADLVKCDPREIVWTSGATESNNLALKGAASDRERASLARDIQLRHLQEAAGRAEDSGTKGRKSASAVTGW